MYTSTAEKIGLDTMKILVHLGFGSEDLKDMQLSYTRFFFFILSPASVYDRIFKYSSGLWHMNFLKVLLQNFTAKEGACACSLALLY